MYSSLSFEMGLDESSGVWVVIFRYWRVELI